MSLSVKETPSMADATNSTSSGVFSRRFLLSAAATVPTVAAAAGPS
jgi:hypothetical protein